MDEFGERRRRAVQRGGRLLDLLDRLKLAVLANEAGESELTAMAAAVREERLGASDEGLQAVLDQIETRAASIKVRAWRARPPRAPSFVQYRARPSDIVPVKLD